MKNKDDVKKLIRESIRDILSKKKKLLMEYTYTNEDYELEIEFNGKHFYIKGAFQVEVSSGPGGFEHDIPFGNGRGFQRETEYEIDDNSEEFHIEEAYLVDPVNDTTTLVTDKNLQ